MVFLAGHCELRPWLGYRELLNLTMQQNLKRIEVIADDESEIVEAVRRMSSNYDFIVTRYVLCLSLRGVMAGTDIS